MSCTSSNSGWNNKASLRENAETKLYMTWSHHTKRRDSTGNIEGNGGG